MEVSILEQIGCRQVILTLIQDIYLMTKKLKINIKKGGSKNVGNVHFFNKSEIKKIFKNWKIIYLYKKDLNTIIPNTKFNYSTWSIVAKKDY